MSTPMGLSPAATGSAKVVLLNVKVDVLSLDHFLLEMEKLLIARDKSIISYANIYALNLAYSNPWFRDFLNRSNLTFCDGYGLRLAAALTGQDLHSRFTPPDFMDRICEMAAHSGRKVFFLGAKPGVSRRAADLMIAKYPVLEIESYHGYYDKTPGSRENQQVVKEINRFCPHILVVGFGMPLQEKWILENLDFLDIKMVFLAGALFDYLSGQTLRAPRWMTDHGLEWLGRLMIEPRRLWKRYLIGNPLFFWRIFIHHTLRYPFPR